ncbi:MAG TPA: DUF922 domain-containing protein [Candidatus Saccharimonadales bacterium]
MNDRHRNAARYLLDIIKSEPKESVVVSNFHQHGDSSNSIFERIKHLSTHYLKLSRLIFRQPIAILALIACLLVGATTYAALVSSHRPYEQKPKVISTLTTPGAKTVITKAQPVTTPASSSTEPTPATTSSSSPAVSKSPAIPAPPGCTKSDWSLAGPSDVDLSSLSTDSVHIVTDPIYYYQVYGYTGQELKAEMNECTPNVQAKGTFFAITKYTTNFTFNWVETNGVCSVSSYTVGVHFAQAFPEWNNSPYDENGLDSYWSSWISSLIGFEQGHINIISQYADQLLSGLASYPSSSDCGIGGSDFVSAVISYGNGIMNQGIDADQSYDSGSGYGPTFTFQ